MEMNCRQKIKYKIKRQIYGSLNLIYGHYRILRNYCDLEKPFTITGEVQHGWRRDNGIYSENHPPKEDERFFIWNRYNLKKAKKEGKTRFIPIGAPFLYIEPSTKKKDNSDDLLLFPMHSIPRIQYKDQIKSFGTYLEYIDKIKNRFSDITLCLYWMEYENKELVRMIKRKGYDVTTLGHRHNNPRFLYKFINLVSDFGYVSSNSFSTAIFYSLYLKRRTFIYGGFSEEEFKGESGQNKLQNRMRKKYPELLWENFDDKCYKEIANKELGLEYKRTPQKLRKILGFYPKAQIKYLSKLPYYRLTKLGLH